MSLPIGNLNLDLSTTDTSMPSMSTGDVRCEITKIEWEESKNNPGMNFMIVRLKTLEPKGDVTGAKTLNPGFPLRGRFTLPGAPGETDENRDLRNKMLAGFIDAVSGNKEMSTRPKLNEEFVNSCETKQVIAVIGKAKPDKDTGLYPYGETEVKSFKHVIV